MDKQKTFSWIAELLRIIAAALAGLGGSQIL